MGRKKKVATREIKVTVSFTKSEWEKVKDVAMQGTQTEMVRNLVIKGAETAERDIRETASLLSKLENADLSKIAEGIARIERKLDAHGPQVEQTEAPYPPSSVDGIRVIADLVERQIQVIGGPLGHVNKELGDMQSDALVTASKLGIKVESSKNISNLQRPIVAIDGLDNASKKAVDDIASRGGMMMDTVWSIHAQIAKLSDYLAQIKISLVKREYETKGKK